MTNIIKTHFGDINDVDCIIARVTSNGDLIDYNGNVRVCNEHGDFIHFDAANALMSSDPELYAQVEDLDFYDNATSFFRTYCNAYAEKYGEVFELAKHNPVY